MVDIPRSSFIPKETPGMVPARVRRKRTFHVFDFLATALLLGSLTLAVGSYFLKAAAEKSLVNIKSDLKAQQDYFKPESISEVREFDRRLRAATFLLNNHVSPLKIFNALEVDTKTKVQFTGFTFEYDPGLDILLSVRGGTEEFRTLALQALQFKGDPLLKDVIFTEIGTSDVAVEDPTDTKKKSTNEEVDKNHKINFTLTAALTPDSIHYSALSLPQPAAEEYVPPQPQEQPLGMPVETGVQDAGVVTGDSVINP